MRQIHHGYTRMHTDNSSKKTLSVSIGVRPWWIAVAIAVAVAPSMAYAQGNGHGHANGHAKQGGVTAGSGSSATPLPASGAATRNFGVWLDDASVAAPGGGWMSVSFGYFKTDVFHEFDAPVADAGVGLNKRAHFGFSIPFYNLSVPGAASSHGLGDLFLHSKIQMRDPSTGFGYAFVPVVEVASGAQTDGQQRVHWALPVSMEMQRRDWRVYGATGYFSRGSLFASAALERAVGSAVISGVLTHSYSLKQDAALDALGVGTKRTDAAIGFGYPIVNAASAYVTVGRTLSSIAEGGTTLSLTGGIVLRFNTATATP